jgi:hypothetical protein
MTLSIQSAYILYVSPIRCSGKVYRQAGVGYTSETLYQALFLLFL